MELQRRSWHAGGERTKANFLAAGPSLPAPRYFPLPGRLDVALLKPRAAFSLFLFVSLWYRKERTAAETSGTRTLRTDGRRQKLKSALQKKYVPGTRYQARIIPGTRYSIRLTRT